MSATPTTDAWLRDREELRTLGQRYARAVDSRDFDELTSLFHPDGHVYGTRGALPVPEYLDSMRNAPRQFVASQHLLADPIIELEPGADTGTLDTYAVVHQLGADDTGDGDLTLGIRYLDTVIRHRGRWVIHQREARMLWARGRRPT